MATRRFEPNLQSPQVRRAAYADNRIVALIDLLGFREAITAAIENDQALDRIDRVVAYLQDLEERLCKMEQSYGTPSVTVVSDSVVLSVEANSDILLLLNAVGELSQDMLHFGFLVRGGITYGPLIHKKRLCYGPAYLRAYELESKIAIWPRIVVDRCVVEMAMRMNHADFVIQLDPDGFYKLHYLRKGFPAASRLVGAYRTLLQRAFDLANAKVTTHSDQALQKLQWFRSYIESCANDASIQL